MAITYLSGQRIQGQTGGQGWVATQTGSSSSPYMYIDKTNGNLAFQLGNNTTSASASYDLTSTSDTQWTMRVKLECSDVQSDGSIAFQMQSVENCATSANADRIGFFLYNNSGTWNIVDYDDSYTDRFWTDGTAWAGSQTFNSTGISASNTTLYVEVKRTSATAGQVSVSTNSDYTTSASTKSIGSLPSSVAGLRYLSLQNRTTGSHTDKLTGTIADIKFWNATNDTTATPTYTATSNTFKDDKAIVTDVPTGSQFEETNTRKFYQFKSASGSTDSWGTGADLTLTNVTKDTAQKVLGTQSLKWDHSGSSSSGTNDYAITPTIAGGVTDFTMAFWCRFNTLGASGSARQVLAWDNPAGGARVFPDFYNTSSQTIDGVGCTSSALSTGTWYFICFTRSGTSTSLYLKALGSADFTTATDTGTSSTTLGTGKILLGSYATSGSTWQVYDGHMDEISFWKRVLTLAEINELFGGTGTPAKATALSSVSDLVAYYDMEDAGNSTTANVAGSSAAWTERGTAI